MSDPAEPSLTKPRRRWLLLLHPFVLITLAVIVASAVGVGPTYVFFFGGVAIPFLLLVFTLAIAFGKGLNLLLQSPMRNDMPRLYKWLIRQAKVNLVCAVICASVGWLHWPLRGAFWVSKPWLDDLAATIKPGEPFTPQWAGLFYIRDAGINSRGGACLWVWPDHPYYEHIGFYQPRGAYPPGHHDFLPNISMEVHLAENWTYLDQD